MGRQGVGAVRIHEPIIAVACRHGQVFHCTGVDRRREGAGLCYQSDMSGRFEQDLAELKPAEKAERVRLYGVFLVRLLLFPEP